MHIASAGIDPDVIINNTTYPIGIIEREDEDNEISLDTFSTENTIVRNSQEIEYSYNKLESVIRQHRLTLSKAVATKAIHAFAPNGDTVNTPLVVTSGDNYSGRKRLQFVDILNLKERFDTAEIPLDERYLVLHPKHVSDLLLSDIKLFKDLTNIKDGEPNKFAGFGIYSFAHMPTYKLSEDVWTKTPFAAIKDDNDTFASVAFHAREVMRADGDCKMFSREDDPEQRGTIIGFDKRFVALPIRGKGIGAIISAKV